MRSIVAAAKNKAVGVWMELALAFLVLGFRLSVFSYAGSPLPYYDQWVAEFNNTLVQIFDGGGIWSALFIPHNEHIILTTKLVSLFGFALNGYWDVGFLAVVSALARAVEAALMFHLLAGGVRHGIKIMTWLACAAIFATPVSGYNLLCGLQISFYLADITLIVSLFFVLNWSSAWKSGAGLFVMNLLGLFSMGSALAIPAATLAAHLAGCRRRSGFWAAWSLTVLSAAVYLAIISRIFHRRTGGITVGSRVVFFLKLFSWPFFTATCGMILLMLTLVAMVWLVRTLRLQAAPFPAIAGLGVFGTVNALLIAMNRPAAEFHMRHWEMIAWLPLLLAVLGINIFQAMPRPPRLLAGLIWVILICYCVNFSAVWSQSWRYIAMARIQRTNAVLYYRDIFISNRMSSEFVRINAMLNARDYSFFDDPILRFTPSPTVYYNILQSPLPRLALLSPEIFPVGPPSAVSRFLHLLTGFGWCFGVTGVVMAVLGFASGQRVNGDVQDSKDAT